MKIKQKRNIQQTIGIQQMHKYKILYNNILKFDYDSKANTQIIQFANSNKFNKVLIPHN